MGRIIGYQYDNDIKDDDAWIGTERNSRRTKQYTAADVAKYLNENGKVSAGTQMVYQYVSTLEYISGTMALQAGGGSPSFSDVTALTLSFTDKGGQNTSAFVDYLVGSEIIINEQKNLLQFGHFKVNTYTEELNNFYTIGVTFIGGQGGFIDEKYYDIDNFLLAANAGDKNFIFTQSSASDTWNIQHNLDKFPSVSVVDSAGSLVVGNVAYVDLNNVTLTFNGSFSGKAYLN